MRQLIGDLSGWTRLLLIAGGIVLVTVPGAVSGAATGAGSVERVGRNDAVPEPLPPLVQDEEEICLECHADVDFFETDEEVGQYFINGEAWASSIHATEGFLCVDCHYDIEDYPHPEDRERVACGDCHDDVSEIVAESLHGRAADRGVANAPGCADCHGIHEILPSSKPASRTFSGNLGALCGQCHRGPSAALARSVHSPAIAEALHQETHGDDHVIDNVDTAAHAPGCADCHGSHDVLPLAHERTAELAIQLIGACGTCHPEQSAQHEGSLHGQAATRGDRLAPSCTDCHGSHAILAGTDPDAPTQVMNIPFLCGECHHEGTEVSRAREIPQERILENYSLSIHGEGLFRQGLTVTAVCTSCHTSHDILPHTDRRSSIHVNNVAETCTTCHAQIERVHVQVIVT